MASESKKRLKELEKSEKKAGDIYAVTEKKSKGKRIKGEALYTISLSNFFSHVFEMILLINNIDEEEYIDSDYGMMKRNIVLNKKFKKLSDLDWENAYPMENPEFRGKFATVYLFHLVREVNRWIKKTQLYCYKDKKKYKVYNHLLDNIITRSDLLIVGVLTKDFSYAEPLQAMTQILILSGGYDEEILEKLDTAIKFLEEQCTDPDLDEGIILNNIMKTAFMLATLTLKFKKTPEYIEGDYRDDDELMKKQLGQLGYAIMHSQSKGNKSFFYRIMVEANPAIETRFEDIADFPEISVACQALELLGLYMDNPVVSRYIDTMIR
jgi:hypothetical protein